MDNMDNGNKDLFKLVISLAFITFMAVLCNSPAKGEEAKHAVLDWTQHSNVIVVAGEVGRQMLPLAQELEKQAGAPVVRMLINSPGGSVVMGNIFIQAMEVAKARGAKIECAVTNLAASMGIHILAHCTTRYALEGAYLLFHEPRTGGPQSISPSEALALYVNLRAATEGLDRYLRKELGLSSKEYDFHNINQTLWEAREFKKAIPAFNLKMVSDVWFPVGMKQTLFDPTGAQGPFGEEEVGDKSILPGADIPLVFPGANITN